MNSLLSWSYQSYNLRLPPKFSSNSGENDFGRIFCFNLREGEVSIKDNTMQTLPSVNLQTHRRIKHKFTPEEDALIRKEVEAKGGHEWGRIAQLLPGRNGRQIRERWVNYLSPAVNNGPWTPEEDRKLEELMEQYGRHWSKIAAHFGDRTDVMLKNRYSLLLRRGSKTRKIPESPPATPFGTSVDSMTIDIQPYGFDEEDSSPVSLYQSNLPPYVGGEGLDLSFFD